MSFAVKSLVSDEVPALVMMRPWILQARTLEWVAISFSNAWKGRVKVKSLLTLLNLMLRLSQIRPMAILSGCHLLFFYIYLFIHWAVLGHSCGARSLQLWHTGLGALQHMDLSSLTSSILCIARQILNHWTGEVPVAVLFCTSPELSYFLAQ